MIKPIQSQERFEQNLKIEQKLSKIHGYNLQNSQYSPKSRSQQKKEGSFMINRSINPLEVKEKQLQKSERLKQLMKQIQQLKMQKQIDKMAERNNNQEVKIIDLLNTKIREYNFLVEHRHLMNRKSRSMFNSNKSGEQKKQDGYYIERLKEKQSQLNKTSSLMSRINKNKQITNIYRDYSDSFKLKPNYKIMNTDNKSKNKKQEVTNRTIKIKEMLENVNNHINSNKQSRYAEDIDFQYPYVNKKYFDKIQSFHEDLRRSTKIKKHMKQKLIKIQSLNTSQIVRTAHDNKIQSSILSQQLAHQSALNEFYNNLGRKMSEKQTQDGMKEKEKYFIMGLRKISPKYVKAEDSKFVTRYKVEKLAKQMMEGLSPTKKKQIKLNIPKMYNRKLKVPDNLPEEEKMVMRYMIEEEDDAYYWTTCRNQKMNLLLKGKIHK